MLNKKERIAELEKEAIKSCGDPYIVINAGAGTGKTTTLSAIAKQYKDKNIAIITFTNAAVDEIKNRIGEGNYYIGTIHRFAIDNIQKMSLIYNFRIGLLRDFQIEKIILYLMKQLDLLMYEKEVRQCIEFITNRQDFISRNKVYPDYFNKVYEEYIKYKEKTKFYDITDAPKYLVEKIKEYNYNIELDGLFVDEAQDLSEDQYELIQLINSKKKVIIGDPKQSIYVFRGADGFIFDKLIEDGYKELKLTYNFRSKQEILDYANSGLTAIRNNGGEIYKDIDALLNTSPQILCRTNYEVNHIKKYYDNVCTIHAAKGLEYDNVLLVSFDIKGDEDKNVYYVGITRARDGYGEFTLKQVLQKLSYREFQKK